MTSSSNVKGVLVTDFDGTMTGRDFYRLVIENLLPPDAPDYWGAYLEGSIRHVEALSRTFAAARADEAGLYALVGRMELDPAWREGVRRLAEVGWGVVVASAGCRWYIERLLGAGAEDVEIHANPGHLEGGRLVMKPPPDEAAYRCPDAGIDKGAIIRAFRGRGALVAYAGDGLTDLPPARLVEGRFRFARGALAERLDAEGLPYRGFGRWSDVVAMLLEEIAGEGGG